MNLFRFIAGNKAQFFYALLVLIFNAVAIYYLFFYSNSQINLAQFLPSKETVAKAFEKPFQEVMKKFVYIKPTPTPLPSHQPTPTPIDYGPTATPQPTYEPLIDCIGPDGQHSWLSQKDCDMFNNAWKTPTPSPVASSSAAVQN